MKVIDVVVGDGDGNGGGGGGVGGGGGYIPRRPRGIGSHRLACRRTAP